MTSEALPKRLHGAKARLGRSRRSLASTVRRMLMLAATLLTVSSLAGAGGVQVPYGVQADLIAKVATFDRKFDSRAGSRALILIVQMPNDAESAAAAQELKTALSRVAAVGDRPHDEQIVTFSNAGALLELVKGRKAAIAYFAPGFDKELPAIRNACSNVSLLTVGATPDYVEAGIVLGFDLVSGRPKLLLNLGQAKKQSIDFPASVLRLMKIYS